MAFDRAPLRELTLGWKALVSYALCMGSQCANAHESPLCIQEDRRKDAIAPFNPRPAPLLDGTKQHGNPIKLPNDPRSSEDTVNGEVCLTQNRQTAAGVSWPDPSPELTRKERSAHAGSRSRPREEKSLRTQEMDYFCGQKSQKFAFNDSQSSPLNVNMRLASRCLRKT